MSRGLNDAQRYALAIRHIEGETITQLAAAYEYTHDGMGNLLRSPEMQLLQSELKDRLEKAAINGRVKLMFELDGMLNKSLEVALGNGRDATRQRMHLVDKVLPTVIHQDVNVRKSLSLSPELEQLIHTLHERRNDDDVRRSMEARVISGEAAIPRAIPRELSGANGGDGAPK